MLYIRDFSFLKIITVLLDLETFKRMGLEATWAKFVGKMARIHRDLRFSRGSQSYAYQRIISDMRSTEELWNVLED